MKFYDALESLSDECNLKYKSNYLNNFKTNAEGSRLAKSERLR